MTGNGAFLDLALVSHESILGDQIIENRFGFRVNKFDSYKLNGAVI